MRRRLLWFMLLGGVLIGIQLTNFGKHAGSRSLHSRLFSVVPAVGGDILTCGQKDNPPSPVFLVLGQSNAGNHGAQGESPVDDTGPRVNLFTGSGCQLSGDPLPGGTGRDRSIWARLPAQLSVRGYFKEPVVALLAVDSSTIGEWTHPGSPLRARLQAIIEELHAARLTPALVLWQQGEADALQGTTIDAYVDAFEVLRSILRSAGVSAPILMAQSTRCGPTDGRAISLAQMRLAAKHGDVLRGPNTDSLSDIHRIRGCHFSSSGLDIAASLWAEAILQTNTTTKLVGP